VSWRHTVDYSGGFHTPSILGQRYDVNGVAAVSEFLVYTPPDTVQNQSVTDLEDGGFVVTWQSQFQDGWMDYGGIYGQRYASDGSAAGSEFKVNTYTDGGAYSSVAALEGGGFVVTWQSGRFQFFTQDGSYSGIYGQLFDITTLYGTLAGDTLDGFLGYDLMDGGDGVDQANYSLLSNNVSFFSNSDGQLVIQGSAAQSEALASVERIQFTDKGYALDLDGNAGIAAKAIIATFGADSLGSYMSAALSVVDGGTTLDGLCDLVVDLSLIDNVIGSSTNGSFVDHVYENVVGTAPSSADHDTYTALLDNGTYTKSSLLALAANTILTADLVTENLIDLIGVPGSADGEMLAIQYDLGLV
jgi:hypothetical protein